MANTGNRNHLVGVIVLTALLGMTMKAVREMHSEPTGASVAAGMSVPCAQQERVGQIIDEEMRPLLHDPRFVFELERQGGANAPPERDRQIAAGLTARGVLRLQSADLEDFTRLRLMMATRSEAVCAGIWSGRVDNTEVATAISQLGDDDLHKWVRISTRAAQLELGATVPVQIDASAFDEGLDAIAASVEPNDRAALAAARAAGGSATPLQGCAAIRIILREAPRLEPGLRDRFLRALSSP